MTFLLNSSLQVQLPQLAKKLSKIGPGDVPESIRECLSSQNGKESHKEILQELLHLLSPDIQKYVEDAFAQDWPFVPPTINPTIMAEPNVQIPQLSQVELLLLSLNFALESEDYRLALSIAFVVDRFVYWCDGSVALLSIVDQIQKLAPFTPVAPQLVIRKARVMKDNGDLHGSIQILNNLIDQKWDEASIGNSPSRWQYKAEHQYINVCAVCVQIKGQIYHNLDGILFFVKPVVGPLVVVHCESTQMCWCFHLLKNGLWKEAISPLMESIEGFRMLPVKDFKGISYSYALLSRCVCRLSKKEYHDLCEEYSFQFDHHCYQAYEFGMMAYKQSPEQRLFISKHLLQSGECLLMYTVQLTDGSLQYQMFLKILEILSLVFYNQKPEEFSQSKDQLFIFIKALFVTCLTLGCSYNPLDRDVGNYLETICLSVYRRFCDIGANQLDSEIGRKNLEKIIPALYFGLATVSQQHLKVFSKTTAGDANDGVTSAKVLEKNITVDLKQLIDSSKEQNATGGECVQTKHSNENISVTDHQEHIVEITGRKVPLPVNSAADAQEREGIPSERTPMVDCEADTKERVGTSGRRTPIVDCEADTQEREETPGERTPMVDCEADTQKREETLGERTPIVDCEAVTKEREETPGERTPMVDCEADTEEREETPGKRNPIVDCEAVTEETEETPGERTPIVDCEADTEEREETPGKRNPIVDCEADTEEREETPGERTPMVDCEADTEEREETPGGRTPIVDCEADTQEREGTPKEGTPIVDCIADTQEMEGTPGGRTPIVDCKADTQEREGTPGGRTPIVDCKADTQEREGTPGGRTPIVDCEADTQDRVYTGAPINVMQNFAFDSGFESLGSSFSREKQNSVLRPRIVGLPSHVSVIESKVSALDKLCRTFEDFIVDTDSSAVQSKDASLVNSSALTAVRQSRKDGTYLANRLLNKFQRQESLAEEPQVNIPTPGGVDQESLSSFLGKLLLKHLSPNLLLSETNSHLPGFNWKVDSLNQDETDNKIQKATLYQYNPVTCVWSGQDTIVCIGKELTLGKGKKGKFRNVYQITFLHQDEPLGKYVSKRYRLQREPLQYMDDVVCQMQAGHYVNLFNQALRAFESDLRIYFLTAAYMLLHDSQGEVKDWMNIEPFVDGEFLKLTNNYDFCDLRGKEVSTSFIHFTYVQSGGKMMVSDLQGWLPTGTQNLIYLTDPQFHTDSGDSSPFDFGQEGMKVFFDIVHPECNEICKTLKLERLNL